MKISIKLCQKKKKHRDAIKTYCKSDCNPNLYSVSSFNVADCVIKSLKKKQNKTIKTTWFRDLFTVVVATVWEAQTTQRLELNPKWSQAKAVLSSQGRRCLPEH